MNFADPPRKPVLVIGCGSELRGDDAAGRVAVDLVASTFANCQTLSVIQLLPEHAELIAEARMAILIDASVDLPAGEVMCERMDHHAADPASHGLGLGNILLMCRELFHAAPEVYCIRIGAGHFRLGESLSSPVQKAIPRVLPHVRQLIDHL